VNARILAEAVAESGLVEIDLEAVQTNIVIFKLIAGDAVAYVERLKTRGVLASAIGPDAVRFVTHLDVDRPACERAAEIAVEDLEC
jgi:threonine aldolase